jgi:hypothetical protein PPSC2_p0260
MSQQTAYDHILSIVNPIKDYSTGDGVDMTLPYLFEYLKSYDDEELLVLNPEFQRGHVWTEQQQIAFIENLLSGKVQHNVIIFNNLADVAIREPDVVDKEIENKMICVDGLQRLTAMQRFCNNEIQIYDNQLCFDDFVSDVDVKRRILHNRRVRIRLTFTKILKLNELMQYYVDLNSGGTVHSQSEIDRVKQLIENC